MKKGKKKKGKGRERGKQERKGKWCEIKSKVMFPVL